MINETPLRTPDLGDTKLMTRRAWWLLVMHLIFPGLPQLLAGKKRLGRIACSITLLLWLVLAAVIVTALTNRTLLLNIFTNRPVIVIAQVLLVGLVLFWIVLLIDTLRLTRLARVESGTKTVVAVVTVLSLVSAVAVSASALRLMNTQLNFMGNVFTQNQMVEPVDGRYNILLLGVDSGDGRDHILPDSITVMSIDAETGQSVLIGIPRDLKNALLSEDSPLREVYASGYVGDGSDKVNATYTRGTQNESLYPDAEAQGSNAGIEAMKDVASGITGLEIQFYVIIDMKGFKQLVDALGGVEIDVERRVTKTKGGKIYGYIEPGVQVLDGANALWFARVRKDGSNDWGRMERQRVLQKALMKQFTPQVVLSKFQGIAEAGERLIQTDVPESAIGGFLDLALKMQNHDVGSLELSPPDVDQSNPNYEQVHQLVAEAVAEASAPSPSPEEE